MQLLVLKKTLFSDGNPALNMLFLFVLLVSLQEREPRYIPFWQSPLNIGNVSGGVGNFSETTC